MFHSVTNDNKQDHNNVFKITCKKIKALYINLLGQPTVVTERLRLKKKKIILHTVLRK